jgi:hypothetical protein
MQVQTVRSDARTTISAPTSGNGTTITQLGLAITPKFSNSKLIMQWMISGEMDYNSVFVIHKDGSLITTAGETGYNSEAGNARWSGFIPGEYDTDVASTPNNFFIQYFCTSSSTATQTFSPAVRASSGTAYTLFLNRSASNAGTDGYEAMVSTGTIWEIAQ